MIFGQIFQLVDQMVFSSPLVKVFAAGFHAIAIAVSFLISGNAVQIHTHHHNALLPLHIQLGTLLQFFICKMQNNHS